MEVTGYQLKRALRDADRRRKLIVGQWEDCLFAFEGEEKPEPEALVDELRELEHRIAALQVAQTRYNLAVQVTVDGRAMSMLEAVKRVGGTTRLEGMLQKAAQPSGGQYYYGNQRSRSLEEEHAERRLEIDRAAALMKACASTADSLREAIAIGNATTVDLDGLDPELLG